MDAYVPWESLKVLFVLRLLAVKTCKNVKLVVFFAFFGLLLAAKLPEAIVMELFFFLP